MGKAIATPELMFQYFNDYRTATKANPITKNDFKGGFATEVTLKLERPLTMEGFENYCFEKGIINDLGDYFSNKQGNYSAYSTICSHIRRIIRSDQIEGGMAGIYNPSITQRLNGLVDKQQIETVESELSPIERAQRIKALQERLSSISEE